MLVRTSLIVFATWTPVVAAGTIPVPLNLHDVTATRIVALPEADGPHMKAIAVGDFDNDGDADAAVAAAAVAVVEVEDAVRVAPPSLSPAPTR